MKKYLVFLLIACVAIGSTFMSVSEEGGTVPDYLQLQHYEMPYQVGSKASDSKFDQPIKLAEFAWQEMIALNWKATYNGSTVKDRDTPDNNWNYYSSEKPEHVIWETFAHRTELRPAAPFFDSLTTDLSSPPNYTFGKQGETSLKLNPDPGARLDLLNCLDEDNEIGSSVLFAFGGEDVHSIGGKNDNQVLYQAKINKAGYDYRKNNYPGGTSLLAAGAKATNNGSPDFNTLKGNTASCSSDSLTQKGYICFPCATATSEGVIEIKTAWRKKRPQESTNRHFFREVMYFTDISESAATVKNDTFFLIGMHIIHKTEDVPTFVIATFEHEDVRQEDYRFVAIPGGDNDYHELYAINDAASIDRNRHTSIYKPVNDEVHKALAANAKTNNYLQHYDLVGVQGGYVDGYDDVSERGSASFFLSNYVIETNEALANFYGSFAYPQRGPADDFFNLVSRNGKPIVAGGCKGCHGVAQTTGTDMSFLMDNTKPVDKPDESSLSQDFIVSQYLQPGQISATQPNQTDNFTQIFLSYFSANPPAKNNGNYVSVQFGQPLSLIPYDNNFASNPNFVDLDGYPKTNLEIDFYDPKTGNIRFSSSFGGISLAIGLDSKNRLSPDNISPVTFRLEKLSGPTNYGFVHLYGPKGKPVVLSAGSGKQVLQLGSSGQKPIRLGVDYFQGLPY